jgi:tetratricopeptide (TPR) repeat protein
MKRLVRIPELTTKAKVLLGVTVFVLTAALMTLIVTSMLAQQLRSDGESYDFKNSDAATRKKDAVKAAQSATNSGDSSKAGDIYEQAIEDEPDPTKKVELAISHSRMLRLAGKFDEAVEVAKRAESYSDDKFLIIDWLAQLHEKGKQYEEAAAYYKQAGTFADSPTNVGRYTKQFYDSEAARMEEMAKKS